jgi:hypothetical protein
MMNLSITSLLAFYGAALSSFGAGWNFYRDLRDKARLKISVNIRRIVSSPDGKWYQVEPNLPVEGASKQLFVVVNVTNVGRRPVKWVGWRIQEATKWKDGILDLTHPHTIDAS